MVKTQNRTRYASFEEALVARGTISAEDLAAAKSKAEVEKVPLERYLVNNALVDTAAYVLTESEYFDLPPLRVPESFQVADT